MQLIVICKSQTSFIFSQVQFCKEDRHRKRRKKLFQLGNFHLDSVSANSGAFAKPGTFNAMTTSIAEIQMHLGLHFKHSSHQVQCSRQCSSATDLHGKEGCELVTGNRTVLEKKTYAPDLAEGPSQYLRVSILGQ